MDFIRRLGGPPPRQPRVVVTAILDATEGTVDAHALHRVRELTDAVRVSAGDISATVDLYRAAPASPAQPLKETIDKLLASERSFPFQEAWSPRQTFQIDAHRLHKKSLEGKTIVGDAETSLARNLHENQRRYPNAVHVVYAYGHRSRGDMVAGLRVDRLPEVLRSGADLLLLDTCWGSAVDTLAHIPSSVKTVVSSQSRLLDSLRVKEFVHLVFGTSFPLQRVIPTIAHHADQGPKAMADAVIREGSRSDSPHVITATDMETFHGQLLPALDRLAQTLPAAARPAAGQAPTYDSPAQFSDLAGYLRHLGASPLSAAATSATRAVSEALSATLVARHASPRLEADGGMSFSRNPGPTLPPAWRSFLQGA